MSGGSYNYLFVKDGQELLGGDRDEELRQMADRLAGLGYAQDAAAETEELICMINQARIRIDVRINRLRDVWHAVEWWDSGDGGEDRLGKTLAVYRGEAE